MWFLGQKRWSPYFVGMCIGILYCFSYYFMGRLLGTTMSFMHVIALIEHYLTPYHAEHSLFFKTFIHNHPYIDWQFALVIALFFGSLVSSLISNSRTRELVPSIWKENFGPSRIKRYIGAFIGGILIVFGARIAGGCTSGFAIAYGLQLAVTGWLFIFSLFITGVIVASILYSKSR
ncbi:YeeE/YedE family protein [bacterium]|jgi:hypothetical protein|nr:YeeE/YedE family protein [bacterium]MBT5015552.1 YeeE/YedE family protein [bacterium]